MSNCQPSDAFDYHEAFSRNVGWVTTEEQERLRGCRVAIAGMGGVGGAHLLTLSRLGIGRFHLADFDTFEIHNFNRQVGASVSTLGQAKVKVMSEMCLDINPEAEVKHFDAGIDVDNLDEFLAGVDVYVDSLDFFALDIRQRVFQACHEKGIPAITVAPLGMGAGLLCFMPGKMSFEEYFQLKGQDKEEQLYRFLVGLAPKAGHRHYLVDASAVDLKAGRGPSTGMAIQMCSSLAGSTVLKILLNRGAVQSAPWSLQIDGYTQKLKKAWRPWGNRNPLQKLLLKLVRKQLGAKKPDQMASSEESASAVERILNAARWAPSGDNTQPWRFEILSDTHIRVLGHDTRTYCVYDLQGRASQIALGAMLETLRIAACQEGYDAQIEFNDQSPEDHPTYDITLVKDAGAEPERDDLYGAIPHRCTQRRLMRGKALSQADKRAMERAVSDDYKIVWTEGFWSKLKMAYFLFKSAKIRLTTEEAFQTHRDIIDWDMRYSADGVPDEAIGLNKISLGFCRWAMGSWNRVKFANRYLMGTLLPRVELDFLPSIFTGAHFYLIAKNKAESVSDYTLGGMAVQRLWLTSASRGLQFQPEMTPLIFAGYAQGDVFFTDNRAANNRAIQLNVELKHQLGHENAAKLVFMGRIGHGTKPRSRSVRLGLGKLIIKDLRQAVGSTGEAGKLSGDEQILDESSREAA